MGFLIHAVGSLPEHARPCVWNRCSEVVHVNGQMPDEVTLFGPLPRDGCTLVIGTGPWLWTSAPSAAGLGQLVDSWLIAVTSAKSRRRRLLRIGTLSCSGIRNMVSLLISRAEFATAWPAHSCSLLTDSLVIIHHGLETTWFIKGAGSIPVLPCEFQTYHPLSLYHSIHQSCTSSLFYVVYHCQHLARMLKSISTLSAVITKYTHDNCGTRRIIFLRYK